jgi:hypothetical protein
MQRSALVLLLALWAGLAHAHKPSDSYLMLSLQGARVVGQWDIALRDLDYAVGLDADGNGEITWGEVKAKHAEIAAYAMARLAIAADGAPCPTTVTQHLIDNHSDGAYALLRFAAACPSVPEELQVTYRLFSDIDPQHKGLLRLQAGGETRTAIFSPAAAQQTFRLARPSVRRQFWAISRPASTISGRATTTSCFCFPCCCRPSSCIAAGVGSRARASARPSPMC